MQVGADSVCTDANGQNAERATDEIGSKFVYTLSLHQTPELVLGLSDNPRVLSVRRGVVLWRPLTALETGDCLALPVWRPNRDRESWGQPEASEDGLVGPDGLPPQISAFHQTKAMGHLLGALRKTGVSPAAQKDFPRHLEMALRELNLEAKDPGLGEAVLDKLLVDPARFGTVAFCLGLMDQAVALPMHTNSVYWKKLRTAIPPLSKSTLMSVVSTLYALGGYPNRIKPDMLAIGPADRFTARRWAHAQDNGTSRPASCAPPVWPLRSHVTERQEPIEMGLTDAFSELSDGHLPTFQEGGYERASTDAIFRLFPQSPLLNYLWPRINKISSSVKSVREYKGTEFVVNSYMVRSNE